MDGLSGLAGISKHYALKSKNSDYSRKSAKADLNILILSLLLISFLPPLSASQEPASYTGAGISVNCPVTTTTTTITTTTTTTITTTTTTTITTTTTTTIPSTSTSSTSTSSTSTSSTSTTSTTSSSSSTTSTTSTSTSSTTTTSTTQLPIMQCSDGIDNDQDGRADYPDDLDCVSPQDNLESGGTGSCPWQQIPIMQLEGLQSVVIYEQTGSVTSYQFIKADLKLSEDIQESPSNYDFYTGAHEFYDLYVSNPDGAVNALGSYITIDHFRDGNMTDNRVGSNIDAVELLLTNGTKMYSDKVSGVRTGTGLFGAYLDNNGYVTRALGTPDSSSTRIGDGYSSLTLGFCQPLGCVPQTHYIDADSDGYGNPFNSVQACAQPQGYVTGSSDCNDNSPGIHPGAAEVCNGVDDDCDGQTDEGGVCEEIEYFCDADNDTFMNAAPTGPCDSFECKPDGCDLVPGSDCNDANPSVNPSETEVCNSVDDDCDGQIDEGGVCVTTTTITVSTTSTTTTITIPSTCDGDMAVITSGQDTLANFLPSAATYVHPSWAADIPGATWIWDSNLAQDPENNEVVVFGRSYNLSGNVQWAFLTIAADNSFRAYSNSNIVGEDAVGDTYSKEVILDLGGTVHSGANNLAVAVTNFGVPGDDAYSNPAGLLYLLEACTAAAPTTTATSSTTSSTVTTSTTIASSSTTSTSMSSTTTTSSTTSTTLYNGDNRGDQELEDDDWSQSECESYACNNATGCCGDGHGFWDVGGSGESIGYPPGGATMCCGDDSGEFYSGPQNDRSCDGIAAACCSGPAMYADATGLCVGSCGTPTTTTTSNSTTNSTTTTITASNSTTNAITTSNSTTTAIINSTSTTTTLTAGLSIPGLHSSASVTQQGSFVNISAFIVQGTYPLDLWWFTVNDTPDSMGPAVPGDNSLIWDTSGLLGLYQISAYVNDTQNMIGINESIYIDVFTTATTSSSTTTSSSSTTTTTLPSLPCAASSMTVFSDNNTLANFNPSMGAYVAPFWSANIPGASWIWTTHYVQNPGANEIVAFQRDIVVPGQVLSARAIVAADNAFAIYLNSALVGEKAGEYNYNLTATFNLSGLANGSNSIEFTVVNFGLNGSTSETNPAGLLYRVDVCYVPTDTTTTTTTLAATTTTQGGHGGGGGGSGYSLNPAKPAPSTTLRMPSTTTTTVLLCPTPSTLIPSPEQVRQEASAICPVVEWQSDENDNMTLGFASGDLEEPGFIGRSISFLPEIGSLLGLLILFLLAVIAAYAGFRIGSKKNDEDEHKGI
ncbi:MAG: putative metal-binding motif-containing protein [Candidatus Altiarchaeota archaeon]